MGTKPSKKASSVNKANSAKHPAAAQKAVKKTAKKTATKTAQKANKKSPPRAEQATIKPPRAPALMRSPEVGAHVGQDQAIRERLRLYPKATTQEIVAMFELDGVKVSPAKVEQARRAARR